MSNIEIKKISLKEINQLQEISKQTFRETFSESNSEENMKNYLEKAFSNEKITTELINENSEFYFAILENKVIGYLKINFGEAQTELKDSNALEIERIYVTKEFHGKNVGQLLYEKAIERARQQNLKYVWLGVWEENKKAIRFYTKNGFIEFDKHIFKLGNDVQTDIMMKLQLNN
ncbi:GNAT family N-acetyltransferase [Flavobacterium hibisci]|uniref:GNAT family N-acetyltransferase n=1 Tax=Flavobacterium hibisci TaxID=1914462 RepID=UPI001CBEA791|nr:GNAT family N-acetyltransferase [Flavobacterium hibisci]MBZ4040988.1 GNAT family N-acetyltransferase [Flavobacterium hibisci]